MSKPTWPLPVEPPSKNGRAADDAKAEHKDQEAGHSSQDKDDPSTGQNTEDDEGSAPSPRTMKAVEFFRLL